MDYNALQHKLFAMDPTDPKEDLAKLRAQAGGNAPAPAPQVDYIAESASVPEGSLQMDRDYSVSDFAALAGIRLDEKQKMGSAGQAKGKDPMPSTSKPSRTGEQPHPLKDKLVGEDVPGMPPFKPAPPDKARGITPPGADFGKTAKSVDDYFKNTSGLTAELFKAFYRAIGRLKPDADPQDIKKAAQAAANSMQESMYERSLTKGEEKEKERLVKGMKKNKSDFKKRYGKDADAVMYATATKNAKANASIDTSDIKNRLYDALSKKMGV
jgi:hypothetical protein